MSIKLKHICYNTNPISIAPHQSFISHTLQVRNVVDEQVLLMAREGEERECLAEVIRPFYPPTFS